MIQLPLCAAEGCKEWADPRFYIHGHGNPGCGGSTCTCPPSRPKPGRTINGVLLESHDLYNNGTWACWPANFEGQPKCPVCQTPITGTAIVLNLGPCLNGRGTVPKDWNRKHDLVTCSGDCAQFLASR